jgi:outer membrane protein assembly factor BamB
MWFPRPIVWASGLLVLLALISAAAGAPPVGDKAPVEVLWTFEAVDRGSIASSPLLAGERVYVATAHQTGFTAFGALYCLDRNTGKMIWRFDNDEDMKEVFSSPCLDSGRLYIGEGFHQDGQCKLYCLDAATGKKLWDFGTESHTESSPCVVAGKVYFGAGEDGVYCLDAKTGKQVWHFAGLHVDANPAVDGQHLYAGSGYGKTHEMFCLDITTGKPVWRTESDLPVWASPTVAGAHVFFGIGNGDFTRSDDKPAGALVCVEARTGKVVWRYKVADGVLAKPLVDERHIYFSSRDKHLYCVDRTGGWLRWKKDLGGPVVTAPVRVGQRLYVAASEGRVACLNTQDGKVIWSFEVAKHSRKRPQLLSTPAVVVVRGKDSERRRIYFGTGLDNLISSAAVLYCLEERD